ncbi:M28 family peptidase [Chryseobacterium sp.]|uniref:M28 family peptidase n=1 Tax=Chryseobacterium sp. TaxID=1871047 RepID=UPI00388E9D90
MCLKNISAILLLTVASYHIQAQSFIQAYQNRANMVSQSNVTTNLQEFGNLGIKTTGSTANTNTLNWLKNKYTSFGYSASQIVEDPFTFGSTSSKNLVITKSGTVYPNTYVIICGHFDTINGPGVNDNGSGTSTILEAARILKDIPTEYSIKFIHFSGEEQGLHGSTHFANNIAYSNGVRQMNIRLVFNLDQVGGRIGNINNTIKCESDQSGLSSNNAASLAMTQQLATCTTLYSSLLTNMSNAYSSDYVPFEQKGEIITGFYENTASNVEHTNLDTFANVDPNYVYNVGKAAVGALQHFAVATQTLGVAENKNDIDEFVKIYPNPAKDVLNIKISDKNKDFQFELIDMLGHVLLKEENKTQISVSQFPKGIYFGTFKINDKNISKKIIIE